MKKIFTLLVLMLTAMAVNAASYPIKVKGVQITDDNRLDVLGDGTVRYQSSNNMLIFNNANITYSGNVVEVSNEMTTLLQINFEGSTTLTSTSTHGISYSGSGKLHIWSNQYDKGSLTINAKKDGYNGIDIYNKANVEIKGMTLTINAGSTAIGSHSTPTTEEITFTNSNVTLHGDKSAIKAKKVNLSGCNYVKNYAIDGFNSEGRGTFGGTVMTDVKTEIESYNIEVAGIKVTSYNADDILGQGSSNKTVYFNASKNELTLKDANITTASNAIYVGNTNKNTSDKTFKIKLEGSNKLVSSSSSAALYITPTGVDSVLIYSTSGGTLDVTANNKYAVIGTYVKKMAIKDCTVKLKNNHAEGNAFKGHVDDKPTYSFINANFSAESTSPDVFSEVYGLNYYGCFMTTPSDGFLGAGHKLASKSATNKFVVVPGKDNIKPNFYYGRTITVKDITLNSAQIQFNRAMDNLTDDLDIKYHVFLAKEKLTGSWVQDYDLTNTGTGSARNFELKNLAENTKYILRLRAMDEAGNYDIYEDLEFTTPADKAPTLPTDHAIKYTAKPRTISLSWNAAKDDFTADDKLIYIVEYQKKGSSNWKMDEVGNATSYTIENLDPNTTYKIDVRVIDAPDNEPHKYARYGEIEVTTELETYSVIVCGTTLTSDNLDDFKSQGLTYNPETKVITLENANISYNAGAAIVAGLGDYTIDLKGENTVNGSESAIGVALGSLTITSSSNGTLSCSSTDAGSATLAAPIGVLTIKDCSVEVYNNNGAGLSGGGVGGLTLDNANVKVYGKTGCICDWMIFEMKNCYVDSPRPTEIGGTEADKNIGIYQNGSPVKGEFVVIKPGVDAINGIAADAKFDGKVYNLQGVQVDENYKGVVIKNGKKYIQK